jgi:hypothetical protein
MTFVDQFRVWTAELFDYKRKLDQQVCVRLESDHPAQTATLIRKTLDRQGLKWQSWSMIKLLKEMDKVCVTEADRNTYITFKALFDRYWMAFVQDASEYFSRSARQEGKTVREYQDQFQAQLTLSTLFTTSPWIRHSQRSASRFRALALIPSSPHSSSSSVSSSIGVDVNTDEARCILAFPPTLEPLLISIGLILSQNRSLTVVDKAKELEVKRIEHDILPKALHAQARIQREIERCVQVPEWRDEKDFASVLIRLLAEWEVACTSHSYNAVGLQLLCDMEEKKEEEEEEEEENDSTRQIFVTYYYPIREEEIRKRSIEYCNSNLIDCAALLRDTSPFGVEATELHRLLDRLQTLNTDLIETTKQKEGRGAEGVVDQRFVALHTTRTQRVQQQDELHFRRVMAKELHVVWAKHRPTVTSVVFGGGTPWREELQKIIQRHTLLLQSGKVAAFQPQFLRWQQQLEAWHEYLYVDRITPQMRIVQKAMELHRQLFASVQEELESRIRSIRSGLASERAFPVNHTIQCTFPACWVAKLGLPATSHSLTQLLHSVREKSLQ